MSDTRDRPAVGAPEDDPLDRRIDAALAAIGRAEAPDGFIARVRMRLDHDGSHGQWRRPVIVALAAVLIAAVTAALWWRVAQPAPPRIVSGAADVPHLATSSSAPPPDRAGQPPVRRERLEGPIAEVRRHGSGRRDQTTWPDVDRNERAVPALEEMPALQVTAIAPEAIAPGALEVAPRIPIAPMAPLAALGDFE